MVKACVAEPIPVAVIAVPVESSVSVPLVTPRMFVKNWEPLLVSARVRVADIYILGLENNLAE